MTFQFKQFNVQQDKCAMKVCTDSCLFGAWVNKNLIENKFAHGLDIGTGTGLLSLMASQGNDIRIDAIEIEQNAAMQAKENVSASKWKDRITVYHQSLQNFSPDKKYDCIFSNPPFFENDLMSGEAEKNAAKHHTALTFRHLVSFISDYLNPNGIALVLLPFQRLRYLEQILSENQLKIKEKLLVRQTPRHAHFRAMICFTKTWATQPVINEIIIRDSENKYTVEFRTLLQDYYL